MALSYPLINGTRYDFSSVEIITPLGIISAVKELSYTDSLEPGEVRGTRAQVIGRTRGKYSAEGSITIYKSEFDNLILALSPVASVIGFMEVAFNIVVNFSETFERTRTNILLGARIKKTETQGSEGEEPIAVKCDLGLLGIDYTGLGSFAVGTKNWLKP